MKVKRDAYRREKERASEHEGDAESGVSVCLLTKSLKSMAALMNISLEKLVQSSAGMNPLAANVIEHHLEAARDLKKKNTLISNRKPLVLYLSPVLDVVAVTRDDHSNHVFRGGFFVA